MTGNERIAEWLDWRLHGVGVGYDEEKSLVVFTFHRKSFSPSTDITLWHGEGGILAEIEERDTEFLFVKMLADDLQAVPIEKYGWTDIAICLLRILNATPARLTAALIKMIEEEA